jgi:hypothetical protein
MRTSVPRRLAPAVAAAGLAAGSSLVLAAPASAAACSGSSGVTVVVDFASLGGGVQVGCAAGDPASGIAALHSAGFSTAGTVHDGPAFVCRISGRPSPSQEACNRTPPATAYWGYWHASSGGSWTYSSLGAGGYNPAPGSVEGWAFGSGARPGINPPAAPAPPPPPPPPKPKPTTKPPTSQAPRPPAPPGAPRRTSGVPSAPPVPGGSTAPGATPSTRPSASVTAGPPGATSTSPAPGSTTSTDPTSATPTSEPRQPVTEPARSSRGLTGSLIGAAIVAALAAAGFVIARWRRTAGS